MRGTENARRRRPWRSASSAVVFLVVVPTLAGCSDDSSGTEKGLDIETVHQAFDSGDARSVTGRTDTFSANVGDVISPSAFWIGDEVDQKLLVIVKGIPPPDAGDDVRVTGTVHKFDVSRVENRLGVDLADSLYDEYRGGPYVWAENIEEGLDE